MKDWKQRLYNNYISTGQAGTNINRQNGLHIRDYPYYSKLIKEHLPDNKAISIVDLACGHGALIYCLKNLGYCNVQGIDISPEQVELANELGLREVKCQAINDFLIDKVDTFDVIFLMDILEHLNKSELFDYLDNVNNALKPDGMVVIHVPNAEGIFGMRIRYGDLTHENCFTPESIKQVLSTCGIRSIECFEDKPVIHGLKSLLRYVLWILLTAPFRLLLAAETGTTNQILSQNMLIIAKKKRPNSLCSTGRGVRQQIDGWFLIRLILLPKHPAYVKAIMKSKIVELPLIDFAHSIRTTIKLSLMVNNYKIG